MLVHIDSTGVSHTNAAVLSNLFSPPPITSPSSLTWIRSDDLIREKARPKGLTQKVSGWTGSRIVMWPATPSSNPNFPKIRKAAARRPLRYFRSSYLSLNCGGLGRMLAGRKTSMMRDRERKDKAMGMLTQGTFASVREPLTLRGRARESLCLAAVRATLRLREVPY